MDLSGLDATPEEIADLLDAISEAGYDEYAHPDLFAGEPAYGADDQAAEWAASLTGAEFAELEAEYTTDRHLPGPQLAGADTGGTVDLANDISQIDRMLSQMQDRERIRQAEDQAERGGRRGSTEIRLATAMRRLDSQTYLYGQADLANWQGDPDIDGLFSPGPRLNALEVADHMRYELRGGARPQGRGTFRPPVRDLAARIGLR